MLKTVKVVTLRIINVALNPYNPQQLCLYCSSEHDSLSISICRHLYVVNVFIQHEYCGLPGDLFLHARLKWAGAANLAIEASLLSLKDVDIVHCCGLFPHLDYSLHHFWWRTSRSEPQQQPFWWGLKLRKIVPHAGIISVADIQYVLYHWIQWGSLNLSNNQSHRKCSLDSFFLFFCRGHKSHLPLL